MSDPKPAATVGGALLARRALLALLLLLCVLVVGSVALVPGRPDAPLAPALVATGLSLGGLGASIGLGS